MFRHHSDRKVTKSPTATTSRQVEYSCDFCEDGPFTSEIDVEIHRKKEHRKELKHLYNDKNTHMCIVSILFKIFITTFNIITRIPL